MKLKVLVTPNARKDEVLGWEEEPNVGRVLRVKVAVPPVDGKANARLREVLAEHFGVSKSKVTLEKGGTSRIKTFALPDSVIQLP